MVSEARGVGHAAAPRGGGAARRAALLLRRLGEARVAEEGRQRVVEQNVRGLEVAVRHRAAVQVDERLGRLRHDAQPLPPRERLRLRREAAEAAQVLAVLVGRLKPALQRAAAHEREGEARRLLAQAVAQQRQQVTVLALLEDGHLALQVAQVVGDGDALALLDRERRVGQRRQPRRSEDAAEAALADHLRRAEVRRAAAQVVELELDRRVAAGRGGGRGGGRGRRSQLERLEPRGGGGHLLVQRRQHARVHSRRRQRRSQRGRVRRRRVALCARRLRR